MPITPDERADNLHRDIMNLACPVPPVPNEDQLPGSAEVLWAQGFKHGHKAARHAAAELVCAALAPHPAAGEPWLNGIPATLQHDEGAFAQCGDCRRYTLDPYALTDRPPQCECGSKHGWSGSFKRPGADARWSGAAPPSAAVPAAMQQPLFDSFKDLAGRCGRDTDQEHAGGLFRDKALQALWDGISRNPSAGESAAMQQWRSTLGSLMTALLERCR
jgi:hypothetical protein